MKISKDQNEITTDDKVVHVFVEYSDIFVCKKCSLYSYCNAPRKFPCEIYNRKDKKGGSFKLKE